MTAMINVAPLASAENLSEWSASGP